MIHLQTRWLDYRIGEDGQNLSFTDRINGTELLRPSPCAILTDADRVEHPACSCSFENGVLAIRFEGGAEATVAVEERGEYLRFELLSLSDETVFRVAFVNIEIDGDHPAFAGTLMNMTINAKPEEYPGVSHILRCEAYPHVGVKGAAAAVFGAPHDALRGIMITVTEDIPAGELPINPYGGAYALDNLDCGSTRAYTILPEPITPEEAEEFARCMKMFGLTQVYLHPGYGMYAHGSFEPNPEVYGDLEGFRKLVDVFHRNGIQVCLQTYTFFIGHNSSHVTPVPHPDLGYVAEFTLAEDLSIDADAVPVLETTENVDPRAGYKVPGSAILWIDDELIHFDDAAKSAPYGFSGCERGFNKTVPAAHKKGARVRILLGYFMVLAPRKESPLFYQIARDMAKFYNDLDIDGFYLDAIDGVFILDGDDYAWYHSMLFLRELMAHLKKPPIFNCCYGPQYPATWYMRSSMGVLDAPTRGYRDFIDVHVDYCRQNANRRFLVPGMGWKNIYPGRLDIVQDMDAAVHEENAMGWQNKLWFPEDIEYLCVKGLALDACMSYHNRFRFYKQYPILLRYGEIMAKYDRARANNSFSPALCDKLSQPQAEFYMDLDGDKPVFYEQKTQRLHVDDQRPLAAAVNPYGAQAPFIRIEALYTAGDYDATDSTLLGWDKPVTLTENTDFVYPDRFDTDGRHALGVRICGDGSGAMVCLRIRNDYAKKLATNEFFIKLDFEGWRYYTFYEAQNCERPTDEWPRCELEYTVFSEVEHFYDAYSNGVSYHNLDRVEIRLSKPCNAVIEPLRIMKRRESVWEHPTLKLGEQVVTLPVTLKSGQFLELSPDGEGCVYDLGGHELQKFHVASSLTLESGANAVELTAANASYLARAAVTFRYTGSIVE